VGGHANPHKYVGQLGYYTEENATSNRLYVRARHLRVDQGRWMSRDPLALVGFKGNLYIYGGNTPLTTFDPSGASALAIALELAPLGPSATEAFAMLLAVVGPFLLEVAIPILIVLVLIALAYGAERAKETLLEQSKPVAPTFQLDHQKGHPQENENPMPDPEKGQPLGPDLTPPPQRRRYEMCNFLTPVQALMPPACGLQGTIFNTGGSYNMLDYKRRKMYPYVNDAGMRVPIADIIADMDWTTFPPRDDPRCDGRCVTPHHMPQSAYMERFTDPKTGRMITEGIGACTAILWEDHLLTWSYMAPIYGGWGKIYLAMCDFLDLDAGDRQTYDIANLEAIAPGRYSTGIDQMKGYAKRRFPTFFPRL
jgi:RHS repeat-associated protein